MLMHFCYITPIYSMPKYNVLLRVLEKSFGLDGEVSYCIK